MCLLWLTRYPKHQAGKELRQLVLQILKIKTDNDRLFWIREFHQWYERHKDYINEKTNNIETRRYWYRHKLLRRSYVTIKRALPNMFHYLANPKIPNTTNGIGGFFSHLKNHLDLHRGLTTKTESILSSGTFIFLTKNEFFQAIRQPRNKSKKTAKI